MKFFGRPPIDDDFERAATPVRTDCAHCGEPIKDGDDGWIVPYLGGPDDPRELVYHEACYLRGIIGSVAHQQGRCSCYVEGSTCGDDPSLTRRQAAEAALKIFRGRS